MPTESEQDLPNLVAAVRAVGTALADPTSGLALNTELVGTAYARSPVAAVAIVAGMARERLRLRDEAFERRGETPPSFPRDRLLETVPSSRRGSQFDAGGACVAFLESFVSSKDAQDDEVQELVAAYGILAFMRLAHLNNVLGTMLVEADERFDTLQDLMAQEALADETEWLSSIDGDEDPDPAP